MVNRRGICPATASLRPSGAMSAWLSWWAISTTPSQVFRRVKGQADRVQRSAPRVGKEYNDGMGGTDLFDFMRGQYTSLRTSKKWWKTLYHWVMDSSMHNAFVLHRWCFNFLHPRRKYAMTYGQFIRRVSEHYIQKHLHSSAIASNPRSYSVKRVRTSNTDKQGPAGEVRVVTGAMKVNACEGADLERTDARTRSGRVKCRRCKYCWNKGDVPVRRDTVFQCSQCKVPLCVTCNVKYHKWVKFSGF